jgi:hypothetical protein
MAFLTACACVCGDGDGALSTTANIISIVTFAYVLFVGGPYQLAGTNARTLV